MLTPADHLVDDLSGQVDGGIARHPDVAARQRLSHQRLAQDGGSVPDGVAFGHRLDRSSHAVLILLLACAGPILACAGATPANFSERPHSRGALAGPTHTGPHR